MIECKPDHSNYIQPEDCEIFLSKKLLDISIVFNSYFKSDLDTSCDSIFVIALFYDLFNSTHSRERKTYYKPSTNNESTLLFKSQS